MAVPRAESRVGDLTVSGNVSPSATSRVLDDWIPSPNVSQDLGAATLRWRKLWVQDVDISGAGSINANRFVAGGTTLVAGNFALSSEWGSTASISAVGGHDSAWRITVTANGSGINFNPTVTLTFVDGAWAIAPFGLSKMIGGTGAKALTGDSLTTTTWTVTLDDRPVAGDTYILCGLVVG